MRRMKNPATWYAWQCQKENGAWEIISGEILGFSSGQEVAPVLMTKSYAIAVGRYGQAADAYRNSTGAAIRLVMMVEEQVLGAE